MRNKIAAIAMVIMSVLVVAPAGASQVADVNDGDDGKICLRSKPVFGEGREFCVWISE